MSDNLYVSCAEVLSLCQSMKDDLEALLDPEIGFAPRMRQICREQRIEYEESLRMDVSQDDMTLLQLEENTWLLLQAVMPARKMDVYRNQTAHQLLEENPYTPSATVAQTIMDASPLLTELVVVREWLHDTAPPPQYPEANTGYWKFTKHSVMQSLRTGGSYRDGMVKELDPDAVNREEGRTLAADDASYEKGLLQALYAYVRAGRLDIATELCRKAHQPWRAASIRGSLLFTWRALSTQQQPRDEDAMEDDEAETWTGNRNRKLWKSTCTRAALNPNLPDHERILYAALTPSPQTATVLKSACRTWEDHLWVQIAIMCEEKQTTELARIGGGFWAGGIEMVEKGVRKVSTEEAEAEDDEWEKEVAESLDSLKSVAVLEGPPADHAFHHSQLYIILDQTTRLLDTFAHGLRENSFAKDSFEYVTMCRFFAHLCLYLQMIDRSVPPMAMQTILEAYLQVLEDAGERELIAMYAGALGDNAVDRYALFLVSLGLDADPNERRLALTRAKEHGLDMERVAIVTADMTIQRALEVLPPLKGPLPSVIAMQPPPSEAELFLMRAIEWTVLLETTYIDALEQCNILLRYLLGAGRVQLAQTVLDSIPIELAAIPDPEESATEYLHYRQFFNIWESLQRVVECHALHVPGMSRDSRAAWLEDYSNLIDQAYDHITKLLTTEWLVTDVEIEGGDQRRKELIRIRQMYIPELIIRLHFALFHSRQFIPENLKRAMALVNIVADSRYKLYEDFVNEHGRGLGDYLEAVRQAVIGGLEHGGSDPFRIVSAR